MTPEPTSADAGERAEGERLAEYETPLAPVNVESLKNLLYQGSVGHPVGWAEVNMSRLIVTLQASLARERELEERPMYGPEGRWRELRERAEEAGRSLADAMRSLIEQGKELEEAERRLEQEKARTARMSVELRWAFEQLRMWWRDVRRDRSNPEAAIKELDRAEKAALAEVGGEAEGPPA